MIYIAVTLYIYLQPSHSSIPSLQFLRWSTTRAPHSLVSIFGVIAHLSIRFLVIYLPTYTWPP